MNTSIRRVFFGLRDIVYRILHDEDYKRLIPQAGFTNIQVYGDYNYE